METETEEQVDTQQKLRQKEWIVLFSSIASSASVELILQTCKCEPVVMEVQEETEG